MNKFNRVQASCLMHVSWENYEKPILNSLFRKKQMWSFHGVKIKSWNQKNISKVKRIMYRMYLIRIKFEFN